MDIIEKIKTTKHIRLAAIALVVLSLLGMANILKFYSEDASSINDPVVQVIGVLSSTVFIIGIALAFISKPDKASSAAAAKGNDARGLVGDERAKNVSSQTISKGSEGATGVTMRNSGAPANAAVERISFEERMALRKKLYFAGAVQSRTEVGMTTASQQSPATFQVTQQSPDEKVEKRFGFLPGKKADPLRELLDKEAEKEEPAKTWKSA